MKRENKKLLIGKELINKMFKIAGYTIGYDDIINDESEWYTKYTMTEEQNETWRKWGIELIKKKLRVPVKIAQSEMAMFDLCYGLKIKNKKKKNGKV